MNLSDDKALFEQAILQTSEWLYINPAIVEKDYYVTKVLRHLTEKIPGIIFKGGTSLSKCYGLIERFSEDIDLNYDNYGKQLTEGVRKKLSETIKDAGKVMGMELLNPDQIGSWRKYNKYMFSYPSGHTLEAVKPLLIVQTAVDIRSFPTELKAADSYIYQYFKEKGLDDIIADYELSPFDVVVQTKERTFVDKIFAVCDYYLTDNIREHSRHLYDLYKLLPTIVLGDELNALIGEVRKVRKNGKMCLSAQDGCDIKVILQQIINQDIFKYDYQTITQDLLFDNVDYDTVIDNLQKIVNLNIVI